MQSLIKRLHASLPVLATHSEAVEPAADQLMVDAVLVHPRAAVVKVRQPGHDRARGLGARKLHARPLVVAHELHAGELRGVRGVTLEQEPGGEVRMDVDDDVFHGDRSIGL